MTQNFNPWHNVEPKTKNSDVVNAIIEIPQNSKAKYELDKESGLLYLDRILSSPMRYPSNYGFVPKTYCDDKDPLDILVISQVDINPLCMAPAKIVGVMKMTDGGEGDDKLIAVSAGDPYFKHINDISELPQVMVDSIKVFFEDYKKLENKTVVIDGVFGKAKALEILQDSYVLYQKEFSK